MIGHLLVHYPVRDGQGATIASALTNIDVHDIARTGRTYGSARYYIVSPIETQRALVTRIRSHWLSGRGKDRIPVRAQAIERAYAVPTIADAVAEFAALAGAKPRVWATAADPRGRATLGFGEARAALADETPTLLMFGTAHGLADEALDAADALLEPIPSLDGAFNHLSVRSAVAIHFDRLLGAPTADRGSPTSRAQSDE